MRKVDFEQGSQDWLNWRKGLLTATDAAMLLGKSPYVTPFKGWQRKVGQAPEQAVNSAMLRGQRDEPRARAMFIEEYGINMTPCCIESDLYNFLGASLDGISDCGKFLLEIKSQNIDAIKAQGIPEFHYYQMQHQILCTDTTAEKCYYTTIWENKIYTLEVLPDINWMKYYIPKAKEFWKQVVFNDPPPLSSKDYRKMEGISSWNSYASEYKRISSEIKDLEAIKESYKRELINLCSDENSEGNGVKVLKKFSKGRIDYKEVIDVLNVPEATVEKFRKPASFAWTVMVETK